MTHRLSGIRAGHLIRIANNSVDISLLIRTHASGQEAIDCGVAGQHDRRVLGLVEIGVREWSQLKDQGEGGVQMRGEHFQATPSASLNLQMILERIIPIAIGC